MARIVLTAAAVEQLQTLIESRDLPASTTARTRQRLTPLGDFPEIGAIIEGSRSAGRLGRRRFILGPWRWMVIVYAYDRASDTVTITAIADARASDSPVGNR